MSSAEAILGCFGLLPARTARQRPASGELRFGVCTLAILFLLLTNVTLHPQGRKQKFTTSPRTIHTLVAEGTNRFDLRGSYLKYLK